MTSPVANNRTGIASAEFWWRKSEIGTIDLIPLKLTGWSRIK